MPVVWIADVWGRGIGCRAGTKEAEHGRRDVTGMCFGVHFRIMVFLFVCVCVCFVFQILKTILKTSVHE